MKRQKLWVLAFTLCSLIIGGLQTAYAFGSQVADPADLIAVNKKATGTKVSGVLTITYDRPMGQVDYCFGAAEKMEIFLRLEKGWNFKGFSTSFPMGAWQYNADGSKSFVPTSCMENPMDHEGPLFDFVRTNVIPSFFPKTPDVAFDLKSVTKMVMDEAGNPDTLVPFVIIDIELAVHE